LSCCNRISVSNLAAAALPLPPLPLPLLLWLLLLPPALLLLLLLLLPLLPLALLLLLLLLLPLLPLALLLRPLTDQPHALPLLHLPGAVLEHLLVLERDGHLNVTVLCGCRVKGGSQEQQGQAQSVSCVATMPTGPAGKKHPNDLHTCWM
jgi:hypothetical protein